MKLKSVVGLGLVVLLATGAVAYAGQKWTSNVTLWRNSSNQVWAVTGSIGAARNSSDPYQMIECEYYSNTGYSPFIECDAYDASGTFATCIVYNPSTPMVTAISSMTAISRIQFELNSSGTCTNIYVTNSSGYPAPSTN